MSAVIRSGFCVFRRNLPIWYGLYVGKLVLALLISAPVLVLIHASVEHSVFAKAISGEWSLGVISELTATRENVLSSFMLVTLSLAAVALVLRQFLNGGIYSSLLSRDKPAIRQFFADCGGMFISHLRITLVMAPVYVTLLILALVIVSFVPDRTFGIWGNAYLYTVILKLTLTYVIFLVGGVLSDIMRLHATMHPELPVSKWFRDSLNYFGRHIVQTGIMYLVYFVPMVACWLLLERLALAATNSFQSLTGVVVELLLFQVCSLLRTGQSLLFTATLAPMVVSHTEPAVSVIAEVGFGHD